jgi:hypothetical protein
MKKLVFLAVVLGMALASSSTIQAIGYPQCNIGCPTSSGMCICPSYTDRRNAVAFCSNWNQVGGCWYE